MDDYNFSIKLWSGSLKKGVGIESSSIIFNCLFDHLQLPYGKVVETMVSLLFLTLHTVDFIGWYSHLLTVSKRFNLSYVIVTQANCQIAVTGPRSAYTKTKPRKFYNIRHRSLP